jgi:hypothetical protein
MNKKRLANGCPVAALAEEYGKLVVRQVELDRPNASASDDMERDFVCDQLDMLAHAASFLFPKSAAGAAFLVVLASEFSGVLIDATAYPENYRDETARRVSRYHYAIMRYLGPEGALEPAIINFHMPDRLDPFRVHAPKGSASRA